MRALLLSLLVLFGNAMRAADPTFATWEFAMSLSGSSSGQLFNLFLVKVYEGQVVESSPLTRENFVHQAQGRAFSQANPDGEDLFRKYDVKQCTLPPDSTAMGFWLTTCESLDDLWKLRFQEYPLEVKDGQRAGLGWSGNPMKPSDRQMELLAHYGMKYPSDLVIGEQLFHLLRDMVNRAWVNTYRQG